MVANTNPTRAMMTSTTANTPGEASTSSTTAPITTCSSISSSMTSLNHPHLRKTQTTAQLIVDGKPFLMLAGELHNSSLSSPSYMSTVFPRMREMNLNTALGGISWEMIEPVEDQFNFLKLDQVVLQAREHGMKLVLIWFGSFKNALSTYVPGWVKRDFKRFPRVHVEEPGANGGKKTIELISPFNERAWKADAKAFGALMKHLKEFDQNFGTVVMVQVENETGLLGGARDVSSLATGLYHEPVPRDVVEFLQGKIKSKADEDGGAHPMFTKRFPHFQSVAAGSATWLEAFGNKTDASEMFMANAFSRFVGFVAAAGKKEYPIPLYTNVWLNFDDPSILDLEGTPTSTDVGGGGEAGVYPSGGAVPHTIDLWRRNAPALDFISPDLYLHDYETVCKYYRHENQPLFIPEQKRDEKGARRVWLAYGTYLGLGCSPFGIDSLKPENSPFTRQYGLLTTCRT